MIALAVKSVKLRRTIALRPKTLEAEAEIGWKIVEKT
jgi:hypothetical protein